MKKFIYTVGVSCSGKTTWAREFCKNNQGFVNINRDDIRSFLFMEGGLNWSEYKFTKERERQVTELQHLLIKKAIQEKKNIVLSDTNLNDKYVRAFKEWPEFKPYSFEKKVFHVDLLEALERDAKRTSGVGYKVITSQYKTYADKYLSYQWHTFSEDKKDAVIVDVDGTIACMEGKRNPFEWDKVHLDSPRKEIILMVKGLILEGYEPIFLSGRDSVCMQDTYDWIDKYFPELSGQFCLFMRTQGDSRKDTVIKKELFDKYVDHKYNVKVVIDDRKSVCRMWQFEKGLNVVDVGNVHEEF